MAYFVYILECSDTTLYIGSTTDIEKRLHAHNNFKSGAKYTRARRPVTLKYSQSVSSLAIARATEAAWKRMTRSEKLAFIAAPKKKKAAKK